MALTGRYDFRKTFTGKVVLRVEEEVESFWSRSGERKLKKRWRNATLMDLTAPEMRMLMDMRMKPLILARTPAPGASVVVVERSREDEGITVPAAELKSAPVASQMPH